MSTASLLHILIRSARVWVFIVVVPLTINVLVWKVLVVPQRAKVLALENTQQRVALQPKFLELLAASQQILATPDQTRLMKEDPSAAIQLIQRLAERHRVHIQELSAHGQEHARQPGERQTRQRQPRKGQPTPHAVSGISTMPLELKVTGRFSQLAHWLSEAEAQSSLQVESWSLTPGEEPGAPRELTVRLTAFLGET